MIYIQKNSDGIPYHFDCACAMYGTIELGLDYRLVTFEEVQTGKLDNLIRSHLFVGSVEFMTEVFKRVGIEQPRLPLNNFRSFEEMKLKDFVFETPKFIKPKSIKEFTGFVVDDYSKNMLNTLDGDTDIIVQDVIKGIVCECRCYIFRNKVVDIRQYSGDVFTDHLIISNFLENELKRFDTSNFPETFVADVAEYMPEYKGGKPTSYNTIIEFNDMWAIGNYGVPNDLYVRMLKDRYFDIIKNKK